MLTATATLLNLTEDKEEWPRPALSVADDLAADSLAHLSPMVDLTAKFHRMGNQNRQEQQTVTPEYHELPPEVPQHPYYCTGEGQVQNCSGESFAT